VIWTRVLWTIVAFGPLSLVCLLSAGVPGVLDRCNTYPQFFSLFSSLLFETPRAAPAVPPRERARARARCRWPVRGHPPAPPPPPPRGPPPPGAPPPPRGGGGGGGARDRR